jgi:hypothetical protein
MGGWPPKFRAGTIWVTTIHTCHGLAVLVVDPRTIHDHTIERHLLAIGSSFVEDGSWAPSERLNHRRYNRPGS